ncbi:hypothetical protein SNE40_007606 [Patella caerulea]|uniref:DUF1279 domain-containing protein n=1 Tax=Patella caerulea TaxID=87958 RepID=A0AAN8PV92_PATCE
MAKAINFATVITRQAQLSGLFNLKERVGELTYLPKTCRTALRNNFHLIHNRNLYIASKKVTRIEPSKAINNSCLPVVSTSFYFPGLTYRCSSSSTHDVSEIRSRHFSSSIDDASDKDKNDNINTEKNLTIFQRFKRAYKEHGKVLVGVHLATSTVWFGCFYSAAVYGFDIIPLLEQLGFSETIMKPFKAGGLGNIALAYLMYKLATPARYTVTLGGTNLVIRYFKKTGKINVPEEDSLRSLYEDGKSKLQENKDKINAARKERINDYIKAARAKRNQLK